MTPLRREMVSALQLRNYSPCTIKNYVGHVSKFARYFGSCPSELGPSEVKQYLHHVLNRGLSWSHYRQVVCGLRFLYTEVLQYDWMLPHLRFPRKTPQKIKEVLTLSEVRRILQVSTTSLKDQAIIASFYGTGVRLQELEHLKLEHIDSKRMLVQVECGKGEKARWTILPRSLLLLLREYYREYRPKCYLFEGKNGTLCKASYQRACRKTGQASRLERVLTPRMLRHAFATHLHESGVDIVRLQALLGHTSISTTRVYTHVRTEQLAKIKSPLDAL